MINHLISFVFNSCLNILEFSSSLWYEFMHWEHYDNIMGSVTTLVVLYSTFRITKFWLSPYYGDYYTSGKYENYFESCLSPIEPSNRDWITYNMYPKESLERRFHFQYPQDFQLFNKNTYDKYTYSTEEELLRYELLNSLNVPFQKFDKISLKTLELLMEKERIIQQFAKIRLNPETQMYSVCYEFQGWKVITKAESIFEVNINSTLFCSIILLSLIYIFIYFFFSSFVIKMNLFKI